MAHSARTPTNTHLGDVKHKWAHTRLHTVRLLPRLIKYIQLARGVLTRLRHQSVRAAAGLAGGGGQRWACLRRTVLSCSGLQQLVEGRIHAEGAAVNQGG